MIERARIGLTIRDLTVRYHSPSGTVTAVDRVSLDIPPGTTLGLAGESGSGKSSLARAIVGLVRAHSGRIELDAAHLRSHTVGDRRRLGRQVQMVFQDPDTALDPRMTVRQTMLEAAGAFTRIARAERDSRVAELLELVGLDGRFAERLPRQLSGGQRQRVAIARAIAVKPTLLIADEITSALDVSVQAAILNTIRGVQRQLGLSMLFLGHNLAAVRYVSDVIAVMYLGQIVEIGDTEQLLRTPKHPYTRALVASIPTFGSAMSGVVEQAPLSGEAPDPAAPPGGCRFHPRCPVGPNTLPERSICAETDPYEKTEERVNRAACHFADAAPRITKDNRQGVGA